MNSVTSSLGRLATETTTYAIRTTVALGIPAYLALRIHPSTSLKTPGHKLLTATLVVLTAPSTLICALGALEGSVRSAYNAATYITNRKAEIANYRWDQFCKEVTTTHGLIRGSLSPISGYTIIDHEAIKETSTTSKSPRILKKEYLVYLGLDAFVRGLIETAHVLRNKIGQVFNQITATISSILEKIYGKVCRLVTRITQTIQVILTQITQTIQSFWNLCKPTLVAIKNWTVDGLVKTWKATEPLRNGVKYLFWDLLIKKLVWDVVIKRLVVDLFLTKLVWNLGVKILLKKCVWIPLKWFTTKIVWPALQQIGKVIVTMICFAFKVISWATQAALKLIGK